MGAFVLESALYKQKRVIIHCPESIKIYICAKALCIRAECSRLQLQVLRLPVENVCAFNEPYLRRMQATLSHVTEDVLESALLSCVFT